MPLVALLRGANLGGRRFSPKAVEAALSDLGVVSIGAAGTFVVRERVAQASLRARLQAEIPFEAPMVLATAREVMEAARAGARVDVPPGAKRFATALQEAGAKGPRLPFEAGEGKGWSVRVALRSGRFVIGARRRVDEGGLYPNEVVERAFGVAATTRDWPTIERVVAALEGA